MADLFEISGWEDCSLLQKLWLPSVFPPVFGGEVSADIKQVKLHFYHFFVFKSQTFI